MTMAQSASLILSRSIHPRMALEQSDAFSLDRDAHGTQWSHKQKWTWFWKPIWGLYCLVVKFSRSAKQSGGGGGGAKYLSYIFKLNEGDNAFSYFCTVTEEEPFTCHSATCIQAQ